MSKISEMTRQSWIESTFPEWGTWLVEDIENEVVAPGNVAMWWLGCTGVWFKTPADTNITIDLWCGNGKRTHGDGKMKVGHQMANMCGGRAMQPNLRNVPFVIDPFAFKKVDAVLATHYHQDHMSPEWAAHVINSGMTTTDENGKEIMVPFIGPKKSVELWQKWGVPADRCITVKPGDTIKIKDIEIIALDSFDRTCIVTTDSTGSRLFSSFVLASYDKTARQYTVLTSAVAVSDPAVLADGTARTDAAVSVKGLSTPHPADAVRLGAASTVVDVSMGDIIREGWSEHAVSFLWNGVTFYYDGNAVRTLDGTVSAYTAAGIRVYLRFLLKAPGESTPACLYVPGAGDAAGYSPNMTDPDAARLLEAFFRFMAERYAAGQDAPGRGLCASFLIGRGVNNVSRNAADGSTGASPDLHVSRYEQLVRLAHTALRASTSAGRVFICLDSHWNGRDLSGGFGAQNYLAAFRSEAALRGDFDWQIACELAASSPRVWLPSAADGDSLTVPSLSSLTDLLSAETYRTAGGSLRQVILTDYAIPSAFAGEVSSSDAAQADTYQASSFAYAYTVAAANPRVEALIYDGVADGAGLYAVSDGEPVRRPIGDTFAVIDTDGAESVLSVARPIVGTAFQRAESGQAGLALPTQIGRASCRERV